MTPHMRGWQYIIKTKTTLTKARQIQIGLNRGGTEVRLSSGHLFFFYGLTTLVSSSPTRARVRSKYRISYL